MRVRFDRPRERTAKKTKNAHDNPRFHFHLGDGAHGGYALRVGDVDVAGQLDGGVHRLESPRQVDPQLEELNVPARRIGCECVI